MWGNSHRWLYSSFRVKPDAMSGQADIIQRQKPCLVSRWWRFESACRLQLGEIVLYPSLTPKGTPYIKSHGIKLGLTGKTFEFVKETLRCIWVGKPPFGGSFHLSRHLSPIGRVTLS